MGLEVANFIDDLVVTNPVGDVDDYSTADDHLRLIKQVLKNSFPNLKGSMSWSYKGATQTVNNSTTLVNDSELVLPLDGEVATYAIKVFAALEPGGALDAGVKWGATGGTLVRGVLYSSGTSGAEASIPIRPILLGGNLSLVAQAAVQVLTFDLVWASNGTPFQFQWAQSVAQAQDLHMRGGSYVQATRLT